MNVKLATIAAALLLSMSGLAQAADTFVVISHEVKDFSIWKKAYDGDKVNRDKAGLVERAMMRNSEKPNLVTIVFEAPNEAAAKAFTSNPALKDVMIKAGVMPPPNISVGKAVN